MSDLVSIELGFAAKPLKEQFPQLSDEVATALQKDSEYLSRLRVRGLISDAENNAIRKRLFKSINTAIKDANG